MRKTQSVIGVISVGLLILGGGCSWWGKNEAPVAATSSTQPSAASENASNAPASTKPSTSAQTTNQVKKPGTTTQQTTTPSTATTKPTTANYQTTLNAYRGSGAYFQFASCRATPGTLSLKKGVRFMLDNRDSKSHKIAIQGKITYSVGAYNYAIAAAPAAPGKYYITCDGGGSAQINVEG